MGSITPRASVLWSEMDSYFPDDDDVEQQQLIDGDDELDDGRTPVCYLPLAASFPHSPAAG